MTVAFTRFDPFSAEEVLSQYTTPCLFLCAHFFVCPRLPPEKENYAAGRTAAARDLGHSFAWVGAVLLCWGWLLLELLLSCWWPRFRGRASAVLSRRGTQWRPVRLRAVLASCPVVPLAAGGHALSSNSTGWSRQHALARGAEGRRFAPWAQPGCATTTCSARTSANGAGIRALRCAGAGAPTLAWSVRGRSAVRHSQCCGAHRARRRCTRPHSRGRSCHGFTFLATRGGREFER